MNPKIVFSTIYPIVGIRWKLAELSSIGTTVNHLKIALLVAVLLIRQKRLRAGLIFTLQSHMV